MYSIYGGTAHLPLFHKQQFRFRGWEKNLCHLRNVDKAGGQSKSHANRHESGRVFPLARRITLVRADRVYTSVKREAYNAQNDASRLRNSTVQFMLIYMHLAVQIGTPYTRPSTVLSISIPCLFPRISCHAISIFLPSSFYYKCMCFVRELTSSFEASIPQ